MGAATDARGKGPLAMSVLCIVVAVGQQVVQRTGFDWFKRTPLTFVNNYPNKRELFKIVDGGDGRKKKKILGILGGGGGTFQAHADDGMVFGWRRVTKTGSSGKAKEESVAVTGAAADAPKRVDRYKDPVDGRRVSLEVYSDEPYVAVLRDYLSLEACKQLEGEATKAGLKSATVLDGAGAGGGVAGERRAKQATIPRGALSSRLVERAAAVGEKIVGYELRGSAAFQEPLAFVEYDAGSEYAAHADGAASGAYVAGGRVASVVHYCAAPSSGGATVFPNLDVKIDAVPKSALFFAYKGSDGNMLGEATAHVGCLIKNGTKIRAPGCPLA
ncbi:procollagen-proline 4-dioxygenase [Aureococcus anophagefferens]|nr:procollagen-proline 4-dioxygenase [Aureococcus anophagefferens]